MFTHKISGLGTVVDFHTGARDVPLVDVIFDGVRRTLQLRAEFFVEIPDIIALSSCLPPPKLEPVEKEAKVSTEPDEGSEETTAELGEERVESEDEDEVDAEEIGAIA